MASSEVIHTLHHIRGFIGRYLVLKIKPNIGQTLGTTDKSEIRKIWLSLRGPILTVILIFLIKSEKDHNGGQTWHIFCLRNRRSKLHYLISLSVKNKLFIAVLRKLKLGSFTGEPLNNPSTVPVQWG